MTDKEFDNLIKDALTSSDVPPNLNKSLLDKMQKKKRAKIISFVKSASAVAAVFICAVAVLSYYNSDIPSPEAMPVKEKAIDTKTADEEDTNTKSAEKETLVTEPERKKVAEPVQSYVQESAVLEASEEFSVSEVYEESSSGEEIAPAAFSRRMAEPDLSSLFNEEYDYKSVIDEKISAQISGLENSEEYTFPGISGSERFTVSE